MVYSYLAISGLQQMMEKTEKDNSESSPTINTSLPDPLNVFAPL